jgi:hypothetical protein
MEPALAEHAWLLRTHEREILDRVLKDEDVRDGQPFICVESTVAVIAAKPDGRTDVRGWYREDGSWVLRRCHGIVRCLAQSLPWDHFYAAVVADGVASLHLLLGTGALPYVPGMIGTREGLGAKVVARNLVVEPWDQWHMRRDGVKTTFWSLPDGTSGSERVALPQVPKTLGEAVDRTIAFNEEPIARELGRIEGQPGRDVRYVHVHALRQTGDRVCTFDILRHHAILKQMPPRQRRLIERGATGYDAISVEVAGGFGLRWRPRGRCRDVAAPPRLEEPGTARFPAEPW